MSEIFETSPHVLIVDDDARILRLLKQFLEKNNYIVSAASSATEAKNYMDYFIFDLIILDVMMPTVTGIEFAQSIKSNKIHVPVILLTALSDIDDRINGLSSGADDYISKPFDPKELLLRMKNLIDIYGYGKQKDNNIQIGQSVSYNMATKELCKNSVCTIISSTEQKLLELLIKHPAKSLSREFIAGAIGLANNRSVDVQIVKLRNKIEDDTRDPKFLRTVRNEGYALYI